MRLRGFYRLDMKEEMKMWINWKFSKSFLCKKEIDLLSVICISNIFPIVSVEFDYGSFPMKNTLIYKTKHIFHFFYTF